MLGGDGGHEARADLEWHEQLLANLSELSNATDSPAHPHLWMTAGAPQSAAACARLPHDACRLGPFDGDPHCAMAVCVVVGAGGARAQCTTLRQPDGFLCDRNSTVVGRCHAGWCLAPGRPRPLAWRALALVLRSTESSADQEMSGSGETSWLSKTIEP